MRKNEFLKMTGDFENLLDREFSKPPEEWNFPEKMLNVDVIATCRSPRCRASGMGSRISTAVQADGVYKVLCGLCNSAIEDLDPMLEDDEDYRLNTRYPDGSSWMREAW